jgi:hypothetical protein
MSDVSPPMEIRIVQDLLNHGAEWVDPSFRVAGEGEAELIFEGERLYLTPKTPQYDEYHRVMATSGLQHVEPFLGAQFSDPGYIVGVVPRDSRTIAQIVRGQQPGLGMTVYDAMEIVGGAVNRMSEQAGVVPVAGSLSLKSLLITRENPDVLFTPNMTFEPTSEGGLDVVARAIDDELAEAGYEAARPGLGEAFRRGLRHGRE